jgi:hypothetical protein
MLGGRNLEHRTTLFHQLHRRGRQAVCPCGAGALERENRLHWRLDVVFREDESRIRKGNAPAIMTAICHLCVNLFQKEPSNLSLKKKRLKAAWNDDFRGMVLFA